MTSFDAYQQYICTAELKVYNIANAIKPKLAFHTEKCIL